MGHPHSQELCDRVQRLSRVHSLRTVAMILGVHHSVVYRIRDRGWKAGYGHRRHVPNDFAIQAQHMSSREMAEHYRASQATVCRWLRERPVRPHWKPGKKAQR